MVFSCAEVKQFYNEEIEGKDDLILLHQRFMDYALSRDTVIS